LYKHLKLAHGSWPLVQGRLYPNRKIKPNRRVIGGISREPGHFDRDERKATRASVGGSLIEGYG